MYRVLKRAQAAEGESVVSDFLKRELEVLLVHPGGPFWTRKDKGAWSIPKGEIDKGEAALEAARREFQEETGFPAQGEFLPLGKIRQKSGKVVEAWAFAGDCDPALLTSVLCSVEWPPQSGRQIEVPEVDRAGWFSLSEARIKLKDAQWPFLDRLRDLLETNPSILSSN
jgi:predicted NUDIX family NTP pyrophosphohydrolase